MWTAGAIPVGVPGREVVGPALAAVTRELAPPAAAFFALDRHGEVDWCAAPAPAPADALEEVRRCIAAHDDGSARGRALAPIRDGARLTAGVAVWRPRGGADWTDEQRRRLASLGALAELAYASVLQTAAGLEAQLPPTLTERQRQVAHLLASGATNPEIARALFISPDTVKSHARTVLSKLGLGSRRELVMRLTEAPAPAEPERGSVAPQRGASGAVVRLGGDAAPRRLMAAVLDWSAGRIDAAIGGCAFFSPRLELVTQAWGSVRSERRRADPRLAARVHRGVLSPAQPAEVVRQLDEEGAGSPVVQVHVSGPGDDGLGELVAEVGLAPPLLAVLRSQGRVTGVVWLCREASAGGGQRDAARALGGVHRLLELARVAPATDRSDGAASAAELHALGLTPRERAVAEMALAGQGNAAIGRRLGISESTVKKHMTRVLAKGGVRSRTQLIAQLSEPPAGD